VPCTARYSTARRRCATSNAQYTCKIRQLPVPESAFCYSQNCINSTQKFSRIDAFNAPPFCSNPPYPVYFPTHSNHQAVLFVSVFIRLAIQTRCKLVNIRQKRTGGNLELEFSMAVTLTIRRPFVFSAQNQGTDSLVRNDSHSGSKDIFPPCIISEEILSSSQVRH